MKKSEFGRAVKKSFIALENKYGFKRTAANFHEGGVIVTYQNETTEICLNYEIGEYPWITIADIQNPKEDRVSLDWLLVELGEREAPTTNDAFFPPKMDNSQLDDELQKQSAQLMQFGSEMLNGDFSTLPKLKGRANTYLAECRKIAERYKAA